MKREKESFLGTRGKHILRILFLTDSWRNGHERAKNGSNRLEESERAYVLFQFSIYSIHFIPAG